ncbi:cohesin subunit SMC1 NDAI_0G03320 [Naumovozyma dairenensis CBS 421]|uniref:Structural maintenance of chromosomes protein n=1 Tax=Naumovozyma dairenensis (strain ATCC 10597 / BCRC 20456 / CBS 421 / NBRC 0211 / NRRL Y-12639) TaxID=1071378 RepID=G0WE98_NAUDC|nr:hypothetical protein NDAI_0G03320 [Naumovozyma dairenensis CBS 421]CCD26109.2 hypothetical protein NDAI_0G03320 [Naumovozyma dairenensis CBS 421]
MGRLSGLELNNFKSYKGITKVGFGDSNFTSIIGPNGSGKSNMMDAISFVLGVRSSHLRSNIVKDLIYRGVINDNGDTNEHGKVTSAYVKAFYEKNTADDGDNDDDDDERPVELMRAISTNGDTTYKINGKTVTYKEYSEFLERENILIKAKNFLVFQGDVEQIASQSPMDLSKLFEEVSGSIQYKKEYDELKEQIEKLNQSAAESIRNRRRIHGELKTYKEGITKDEEYKNNIEKRKKYYMYLVLWQLYHLENEKKKSLDNLKNAKSEISQLKNKITNEEKNLQRSKSSFLKENLKVNKKREQLNYQLKEKDKLLEDLNSIKIPQRAASKRINNIEKRIESIQKDIERQQGYINTFENQLKVVTKAKESFEREIKESAQNSNKYSLSDDDLKLYESLNEKYLMENGSAIEQQISLLNNDKQEVLEEMDRLNRKIDASKKRITEELLISQERIQNENIELVSSLNEKNSIFSEKTHELKTLQAEIESSNNQEYDTNYKLRETLLKLDDLNANQRESIKEKKLRENVTMLKRFFPGVRGLVHDLCRPKKDKYGLAVSTILGKNFDSIIVDNLNVAQECIAFFKKQRSGTASFIPLDTISSEQPTLNLPSSQDYILTINAIEYDPEYERAMQYVCSDSIICNSLDIARDLKWNKGVRSKLVTIEGALIHKAGLMTGGISKDSNNRWDKEEYQSLMTLKDKLLLQVEEISTKSRLSSTRARDVEIELSTLNAEISSLRMQLSQVQRSLDENKTEINHQNTLLDQQYNPKLKSLKEKVDEFDKSWNELKSNKEKLQNEIFKELTDKVGFTIEEYERHSGELLRKQSKELQQLQKEILNIENKLQFEIERLENTQKRLTSAESNLEKAHETLKSLQKDENELAEQVKQIESEINSARNELDSVNKVFTAQQLDINRMEESLGELNDNSQTLKRNRDEIKEDIAKNDLERIGILKNAKVTNIDIPVISETNLSDLPIDRIDEDTISVSNEIDVDYTALPAKYKEEMGSATKNELDTKIKNVEDLLDVLQPNARAADRFTEAQERFEIIDGETEKIKTTERKALQQFLKIKKKRKELFENAFDFVSEHLDNIYRELTRNPNSSADLAGGNASLTLEDEDEPFNAGVRYHATPPLKRFKDMEYLSGGEKTVAALALLFAINAYQPSPFFVLDEVDAALDITNVERIAAYIRRHGNPNLQFIVISLKNTMFEKSDALVGVFRQQQENSSKIVTLDLRNYAD